MPNFPPQPCCIGDDDAQGVVMDQTRQGQHKAGCDHRLLRKRCGERTRDDILPAAQFPVDPQGCSASVAPGLPFFKSVISISGQIATSKEANAWPGFPVSGQGASAVRHSSRVGQNRRHGLDVDTGTAQRTWFIGSGVEGRRRLQQTGVQIGLRPGSRRYNSNQNRKHRPCRAVRLLGLHLWYSDRPCSTGGENCKLCGIFRRQPDTR